MSIVGQVRATRDVYQLRSQIVALEDQLAEGTSTEPVRHRLARLLREQADLLELSALARMVTMLPAPHRLRENADRLDADEEWDGD